MRAHTSAEDACPLASVDQRLADAHRLWHQAEAAYFDPDGFRLAVQNAIQTLRTVTFILQKNKEAIPGFAEWYGEWQQRLYADQLMRWMVEARNRIEKQGDLEARSFVRAEILASYLDEGPRVEVAAHLFQSPESLLHSIPDNALGQHVRRHGTLRIQRRWVENTLPNYELLDAVAIAYGKVSELVHDAHRQIGFDPPQRIHDCAGESYDLPAMGWRFPCMIGHETARTLMLSLADGSRIEIGTKSVPIKMSAAEVAALMDRYGDASFEAMGHYYNTNAELGAGYFAMARSVFLRDRHHISIMFLLRDRRPVKIIDAAAANVQQKYLMMRHLAELVTTSGADTAILIGEVWQVQASQLRAYERPADSPDRTEALVLLLAGKSGGPLTFSAEIVRDGETVLLGNTEVAEATAAFEFAPFYQAWGRPVPESWMEASRTIMATARG